MLRRRVSAAANGLSAAVPSSVGRPRPACGEGCYEIARKCNSQWPERLPCGEKECEGFGGFGGVTNPDQFTMPVCSLIP